MFGLGWMELIIIALVVLVIFGAGKLPSVMGELGKGIDAFKKSMNSDNKKDDDKK